MVGDHATVVRDNVVRDSARMLRGHELSDHVTVVEAMLLETT